MQLRVSSSRRKWFPILVAIFLALALGGYAAVFASIRSGVTDAARSAMARYPGDRVEVLSALVSCETCSLSDRNRAVWTLGQLRDHRALPVLEKHSTGHPCNHAVTLCQHETRKAINAIRSRSFPWLGYRDLAFH